MPNRRLFSWKDAYGRLWTGLVEAELAEELDAMEREVRNEDRRWNRHTVTFTDLGTEPAAPTLAASAWEGPRFRFTRLIGEGSIWDGPPERYRWCHGRRLLPGEACLDCDRTGRDLEIPGPGDMDGGRRQYTPSRGLKGGR